MAVDIIRELGEPVAHMPSGAMPDLRPMHGRWVRLEPVSAARHAADLHEAVTREDPDGAIWTYMAYGPWQSADAFSAWLEERALARDPWFYAIVPRATGRAAGMGAFMRCDAANGVIEIGNIWMSPGLQRSREATEAIFLMIRHCFDELGVRRLEWKCDSLNEPSRRAAERFGFRFEGIFQQHMIIKCRNRDTAWYAMLDRDWPRVRGAFERWLEPGNFTSDGRQKAKLQAG